MNTTLSRRQTLALAASAAAIAAARAPARAAAKTLNVLAHRVHHTSLTTGAAGDLTKSWREANDADCQWTTLDVNPLADRLLREASLGSTDFGVGFLVNSRGTRDTAKLLHPLDDYQAKAGVEDFGDIAPGLVAANRIDGKLVAIPFRHATMGLFYNEALLEERGVKAPPSTLEELVDQAKRLTYQSSAGAPVVGMVVASDLAAFPVCFARAFGGDFIGPDLKLVPDPEALTNALAVMQDLFKAGALPRTYATTSNDDQVTWVQQGRAAFTLLPFARYAQLNHREQSKFPGKIKAIEFPISASLKGKTPFASIVEFWSMCIPAPARDKDLAWSFIRAMSAKAVTTGAARNGNGPVRVSTYKDADFAASQPLAAIEAAALAGARVPLPAFPEAARAQTIFIEEVQLTVLGRKAPKDAVAAIIERVKPLIPA